MPAVSSLVRAGLDVTLVALRDGSVRKRRRVRMPDGRDGRFPAYSGQTCVSLMGRRTKDGQTSRNSNPLPLPSKTRLRDPLRPPAAAYRIFGIAVRAASPIAP